MGSRPAIELTPLLASDIVYWNVHGSETSWFGHSKLPLCFSYNVCIEWGSIQSYEGSVSNTIKTRCNVGAIAVWKAHFDSAGHRHSGCFLWFQLFMQSAASRFLHRHKGCQTLLLMKVTFYSNFSIIYLCRTVSPIGGKVGPIKKYETFMSFCDPFGLATYIWNQF